MQAGQSSPHQQPGCDRTTRLGSAPAKRLHRHHNPRTPVHARAGASVDRPLNTND
jgi:hypothetical protein